MSNPVSWNMSLLTAGGLEPDDLQGPFQPKPFYDSTNPHFWWRSSLKT